jgi:hypothetical protein
LTPTELWTRYPVLFHMAEAGSWPSIKRHGLLSTQSLLDLFEIGGERRQEILERRRPELISIEHPKYGRAVIRDQKPLSEKKLAGCLRDGLTPPQWLRLLNSKVFFWVDPKRLTHLREARAYREVRQLVLTISTRDLVEAHLDQILLTDRNTGATSPMAHPRGLDTFVPVLANERRRIVELVVDGGVPDISRFVIAAVEEGGGRPAETLKTQRCHLPA